MFKSLGSLSVLLLAQSVDLVNSQISLSITITIDIGRSIAPTSLDSFTNSGTEHQSEYQATAFFLWSIGSFATLDATYQLAGELRSFTAPDDCTFLIENGVLTDTSLRVVHSQYSVGCEYFSPSSCCPHDWHDLAYYTGGRGSCPEGYKRLVQTTEGLSLGVGARTYRDDGLLISNTASVLPCCPLLTYSDSRGRVSSVPYDAAMEPVLANSNGVEQTRIQCSYDSVPFQEITTESGTAYTVYRVYRAFPLYIFDDAVEATSQTTSTTLATSTAGRPPSSSTASPVQTVPAPATPTDSPGTANGDPNENKSGLSTAAIAGIAVGVGVPLILVAVFVTWCLTRRNMKPMGPEFSNRYFSGADVGGLEPGINDNTAGAGGVHDQRSGPDRSYYG